MGILEAIPPICWFNGLVARARRLEDCWILLPLPELDRLCPALFSDEPREGRLPPLVGDGDRILSPPRLRGGSCGNTRGESVPPVPFPLDPGRELNDAGIGEVNSRTLRWPFEEDGLAEELSVGNRILEVSSTNATVDSSFPATEVADSPPRTTILSRDVVKL